MSHFLGYFILEFYLRQHSLMHAHHLVPTLYFGDDLILGKQCMVEWKLTKFLVNNMFNTDNKDNKWKRHKKLHKQHLKIARATGCHNLWRNVCHIPGTVHVCYENIYLLCLGQFIGCKNILIRAEGKLWVFLMIVMRMNAVLDWIKHVCFQPALWLTVSAALFFVAVWVFTAWVFATWNSSIT